MIILQFTFGHEPYVDNSRCAKKEMGITFSRILSVFTQQIETGTQIYIDSSTHGTQTTTRFSEKLTNFGTIDIGSAESFDQACNICDLYTEKEAVGYCCVCEQYMCYQCCKHHEKITMTKNHKIVDKEEFGNVRTETSYFSMHLVPIIKGELPKYGYVRKYSYYPMHVTFIAPFYMYNKNNIYYLNYGSHRSPDSFELGTFTTEGNYKTIESTIEELESDNETVIKYFTKMGSRDIWQMKYCNENVSYKSIFTKSGKCYGVVPFDNGLAISLYIETGFTLPDWQNQYVDLKGNVKRQIYCDSEGKQLLKKTNYLSSNDTEDILFVSNGGDNSVIALDPKGNVIYKFTHDAIQYPKGLTCDEENNVYVACINKVIQINKHGKRCRVLLDSKAKDITHLCYDKQNRRLAVIEESKTVTVFAFLP